MINEFANSTLEYPLTVTLYVAFLPISNSPKSILGTLHQFITLSPSSGCDKTHWSHGENQWVSLAQEGTHDCASALPSSVDPHQPMKSPTAATPNTRPNTGKSSQRAW
ncbi:conserved hypothetical protein [Mesorhizobium escarrei]|uniref:Uncharacterized protein n=1 Tax=Mesorhizobium escarrei TaxID=666018 RepID=A0ABM9E844_9HYPH|nr:conserved hypothetical protein [Mesorhizobium escarrei]